jgi:hypothetical protein
VAAGGVLDNLSELTKTAANRKALTVGIGLVLLQQLSGQPSVLYYANRIFERAGLGPRPSPHQVLDAAASQ